MQMSYISLITLLNLAQINSNKIPLLEAVADRVEFVDHFHCTYMDRAHCLTIQSKTVMCKIYLDQVYVLNFCLFHKKLLNRPESISVSQQFCLHALLGEMYSNTQMSCCSCMHNGLSLRENVLIYFFPKLIFFL